MAGILFLVSQIPMAER
jgi:hypothetical protein